MDHLRRTVGIAMRVGIWVAYLTGIAILGWTLIGVWIIGGLSVLML